VDVGFFVLAGLDPEEGGFRVTPRAPLVVALFVALMAGIGYAAIYSSNYDDVSKLRGLDARIRAIVRGDTVDMGVGRLVLEVDGRTFTLEARGLYGLAYSPGSDRPAAVFILKGRDGFEVLAIYTKDDFVEKYGTNPVVDPEVVVDGVYDPAARAVVRTPGGEVVGEYNVVFIDRILKGCHRAYSEEPGRLNP
jgi:hypothetical protein